MGSFTIPKDCICITRNYDYDFASNAVGSSVDYTSPNPPYRLSRPVDANASLHRKLKASMESVRPQDQPNVIVRDDFTNASADRCAYLQPYGPFSLVS